MGLIMGMETIIASKKGHKLETGVTSQLHLKANNIESSYDRSI
jgi:hypothetical protein